MISTISGLFTVYFTFVGLGVRILLDVIRITQPTHIIQIDSNTDPMKNLPALTEEFLLSEEGWTDQTGEKRSVFLS